MSHHLCCSGEKKDQPGQYPIVSTISIALRVLEISASSAQSERVRSKLSVSKVGSIEVLRWGQSKTDSNFFVLDVGRGNGVLERSLEIAEVLRGDGR